MVQSESSDSSRKSVWRDTPSFKRTMTSSLVCPVIWTLSAKLCAKQVSKILRRHIDSTQNKLILAKVTLDRIEVAGQNDLSMIDDNNILAKFLDIAHLVAGENDDLAVADQLLHNILQNLGVDRIKTAEGLV